MSELLVDRERELAALERAVETARDGMTAALCLRGPAGIGKTALLERASELAPGLVLRCSGSVLEVDHPYGAVLELTAKKGSEPFLAHAGPVLRALVDGKGALASVMPPADARMSMERGLFALLAAVGEASPGTLVIVDDLHWVDVASRRAFAHLARGGPPGCALLLATRPSAEDEPVARELLRRVEVIDLQPLAETGVAELAARSLPESAAAEVAPALREQTGGNPLLVTRVLADLARSGGAFDGAAVRAARPPEIAAAVAARLDDLGDDATRLAESAVVLGADAALVRRAAALAGLPIDGATAEAARLVAADLLEPGDPLRFVHPLVAAAVVERMNETEQAAAHLRAARLLSEDGARPGAIAARLLASVPSGETWAIAALRDAGIEALNQGDPTAAARLLRRALDEGPGSDDRAAIALPLARASAFAGDIDAAERMEAALALAADPATRVMALLDHGDALVSSGRPRDAQAVLDRAFAESAADDVSDDLRAYAALAVATAAWVHPREKTGSDPVFPPAAAAIAEAAALALSATGSAEQIDELTARGLSELTGMARLGTGFLATMTMQTTDAHGELQRLHEEGLSWAHEVGSPLATGTWLAAQGILTFWLGNVERAVDMCRVALGLEQAGWDRHAASVRAVLAQCELERGRIDAARDTAGDPDFADRWRGHFDHPVLLMAQARLAPRAQAVAILRDAGESAESMGVRNPVLMGWRAELALAVEPDDPSEAAALAAEHTELAERLGTPRALGVALRTTGVLERDPDKLRDAARVLADSPARLEQARAELALGEALRRAGYRVDARTHLHAAIEVAEACGALAIATRARDELRAAGGRDRRGAGDELTPGERRVAELAATGASNPEIAEQLFLGRRTVEMHLSRSYRKLGISGREELAARLGTNSPGRSS